jgi:predicted RNase H-like HicB family nuclease
MAKDLEFSMNNNYRVSLHFDSDGYWVAEHPELPGCIADGETPQDALSSLNITRELWIESRLATGLEVPEPQEEPQYSGKFVLRVAKRMHRELAQEAEAEGVSLNTHISNILASRNARSEQPSTTQQNPQDFAWAIACAQGGPIISTQKDPWDFANSLSLVAAPRGTATPYQFDCSAQKPLMYKGYQEKEVHVA